MSRTDFRTASDVDAELAVGVAAKMFAAAAFDDRWDAIRKTLEMLGASAVNVAALCRRSALPFWFRSSPPPRKLSDYVSEGLMASDLIIRHAAASSAPFHWRTADRTGHEDDPARRAFVNFVRDSGHRSIVCLTVRPKRGADVRVVTFCSEHAPGEVMTDAHLRRIEMAIRLLLPWLDWPERAEGPGFLPVSGPELSPRQTQALRLLAGMNARIADAMGVGEATVAKHLASARRKLNAKTRDEICRTRDEIGPDRSVKVLILIPFFPLLDRRRSATAAQAGFNM